MIASGGNLNLLAEFKIEIRNVTKNGCIFIWDSAELNVLGIETMVCLNCGLGRSTAWSTSSKTDAISMMQLPKDVQKFRSYIGAVKYNGRFVKQLKKLRAP